MHCLDCALRFDLKITAAARCAHCGAGVCADHAAVIAPAPAPVGMVPAQPGRRVISCLSCSPLPCHRPAPNRLPARTRLRRRLFAGS